MDLAETLRDRNLKATSKRLEVLSVINDYGMAIGFSKIQQALHNFDRVTLYRTIQSLIENGIIHVAFKDKRETFYAVCSTNCTSENHRHKHVHFKCTKCKEVTCVQSIKPVELSIKGHIIQSFELEATGICVACNKKDTRAVLLKVR